MTAAPRGRGFPLRRLGERDFWLRDEQSLVVVALIIGALSGLAAAALVGMIDTISRLLPAAGEGRPPWWIVLVPAAGGLLVGPIVTKAAPETKGQPLPE